MGGKFGTKKEVSNSDRSNVNLLLGAGLILAQILATYIIAYAALWLLQSAYPVNLSLKLPLIIRTVGLVPAIGGIWICIGTLRVRPLLVMLTSTSVTLLRLFKRNAVSKSLSRSESFQVTGTYKYVRNPLYLGAVVITVSWGIITSSILMLVWAIIQVIWLWFALIPYEERELLSIFGDQYSTYKTQVPRLFPNGKKYHG